MENQDLEADATIVAITETLLLRQADKKARKMTK